MYHTLYLNSTKLATQSVNGAQRACRRSLIERLRVVHRQLRVGAECIVGKQLHSPLVLHPPSESDRHAPRWKIMASPPDYRPIWRAACTSMMYHALETGGTMKRRAFAAACAAAAWTALVWPAISAAQESRPRATSAGAGDRLEEIVVTATKQAESVDLAKVPISISAYSQQDLDSQGVKTIAEIA